MLAILDMQMGMLENNKVFYRKPMANKYTMMANLALPDGLDCFPHLITDFLG